MQLESVRLRLYTKKNQISCFAETRLAKSEMSPFWEDIWQVWGYQDSKARSEMFDFEPTSIQKVEIYDSNLGTKNQDCGGRGKWCWISRRFNNNIGFWNLWTIKISMLGDRKETESILLQQFARKFVTFNWHFNASNQASSFEDVWVWKSEYQEKSLPWAIFGITRLTKN